MQIYDDLDLKGNKLLNADIDISEKKKKVKIISMQEGVLQYTLDELPSDDEVECKINGLDVDFTRDGVNITITHYTPGTIETGWQLKIYYFI